MVDYFVSLVGGVIGETGADILIGMVILSSIIKGLFDLIALILKKQGNQ